MATGLAHTASGSSREAHRRAATGEQLRDLRAFRFLEEDRLAATPLRWRGEQATTIAYYALRGGDKRHRDRFYLTRDGHAAEFDAERQ